MKKGLIAAGLLVSLSGTAQDVSTYTPGTMGEGVVYYLPKTEIELQVIATKVVYTPGEFCQYADRYLRLTGISSQPEEHWEINSIKVNSIGIPDPDNAYAVKLKDKSAASQVELTPEGIIKAINTTSPIEKAPVTKVADTAKKRIDPRSFMTEEILIAGSTAKMAELVAKEIYNIRESKNSLTRGQADYMPKDGAALKLMLDNLDEQEQAMMQMFAGTTDRTEKSFTIRIKPEAGMKEKVAFRFSKKLGMLDADNLSGEPYYISIINQETLPPVDPKGKEKKKTDGVIYNIPAYVPQVYAIYDNLAKVLQDAGVTVSQLADKSYISNPVFIEYAEELAKKFGIPFQETVRRGGSTNAGKISLTAKAVPVLVLGVPSRYVHTHYNFCAKSDLEAAADLAVEVIRGLDAEKIRHICRQDILK